MGNKIYGYCRISTVQQHIERQVANIKAAFPNAEIVQEVFTGTKIQGRKKFEELIKEVKTGDTIVFDSVSRMSRDADEGVETYQQLYDKGIELVFLKEQHINTAVYKDALTRQLPTTGEDVDYIIAGINKYLMALARTQVRIAFDQAEKEVMDLRQRTREGIQKAKERGAQVGAVKGKKLTTKKSVQAKEVIRKHNKTFGGTLSDAETWTLAGISKMTFYKYKRELINEINA